MSLQVLSHWAVWLSFQLPGFDNRGTACKTLLYAVHIILLPTSSHNNEGLENPCERSRHFGDTIYQLVSNSRRAVRYWI